MTGPLLVKACNPVPGTQQDRMPGPGPVQRGGGRTHVYLRPRHPTSNKPPLFLTWFQMPHFKPTRTFWHSRKDQVHEWELRPGVCKDAGRTLTGRPGHASPPGGTAGSLGRQCPGTNGLWYEENTHGVTLQAQDAQLEEQVGRLGVAWGEKTEGSVSPPGHLLPENW